MQYQFSNIFLEKKDILNQKNDAINPFLLENNTQQLEKFWEFYKGASPLLVVNGFLGTGKVQLVNYSLNFLSEQSIVFRYSCFESTVLDDILLAFFAEFKNLVTQGIVEEPRIKTESFTQKVNSFFTYIDRPFVIILDSFEAISPENKNDVLDFVKHLTTFEKIKTIIIARTFEQEDFKGIPSLERITTFALQKPIFEKFIKDKKIKYNAELFNEFYKQTRGYYFHVSLSLKIMEKENLSLSNFLAEFQKSFLTFFKFLEKKSIELIDPTVRDIFWFLSTIRHGVSLDLLKSINLYDEIKIQTLINSLVIVLENNILYVQDYFKEQVNLVIAPNIVQKLHRLIVDIYESQLPLKPLARSILISRQSMRKEIEYHKIFLPKQRNDLKKDVDIDYMTYSTGHAFEAGYPKDEKAEEIVEDENVELAKDEKLDFSSLKGLEVDLKNVDLKLTKEEMDLLESAKEAQNLKNIPLPIEVDKPEELSFTALIEKAKAAETDYDYKLMIFHLKQALDKKDDENYKTELPLIYTKIALAYQKLAQYENAVEYYKNAENFYSENKEQIKANYIKLSIANIHLETYKLDEARGIIFEIIKNKDNPPILTTKSYLALANLEDSISQLDEAYKYFIKALETSNDTMDIETLSELYFKYALASDDKGDAESAMIYYEKCIELSKDAKLNKFLSSAYSNLATIYLEKQDKAYAFKLFQKAYEIDETLGNYDGMYFSATKIAEVIKKQNPEKALEFFEKAKNCAEKLNDIFYMASAALALGDFYYDKKDDAKALHEYFWAYNLVENDFSKENLNKIKTRINDIKFRAGVEKFEQWEKEFNDEK